MYRKTCLTHLDPSPQLRASQLSTLFSSADSSWSDKLDAEKKRKSPFFFLIFVPTPKIAVLVLVNQRHAMPQLGKAVQLIKMRCLCICLLSSLKDLFLFSSRSLSGPIIQHWPTRSITVKQQPPWCMCCWQNLLQMKMRANILTVFPENIYLSECIIRLSEKY